MNQKLDYEMSLEDFIEDMRKGWGFRKPYRVSQIGERLQQVFSGTDRTQKVRVRHTCGSYGRGPDFHYTYNWEVGGVELPMDWPQKVAPGRMEAVFGYQREELPEIHPLPGGFRCGFVW